MEHLNYDNKAYQTVHSHWTETLGIHIPKNGRTGDMNLSTYNTYMIDMDVNNIFMYVNGNLILNYPRFLTPAGMNQFPFYRRWYLLLDMQLGGDWVGPIDPTTLPVEFWVDWVRYYEKA
jgi:hypothetical protein